MRSTKSILVALAVLSTATPSKSSAQEFTPLNAPSRNLASSSWMSDYLSSSAFLKIGDTRIDSNRLQRFYKHRNYQPAFISRNGPSQVAQQLGDAIWKDGLLRGLDPSYYWTNDIEERWSQRDSRSMKELEILLASAFINYAHDVATGRTTPSDESQNLTDIELPKAEFNQYKYLNDIVASPNFVRQGLIKLDPPHHAYSALVNVMTQLQVEDTADFRLITGPTIKPGESADVVPEIRRRLYALGIIRNKTYASNLSPIYDSQLKIAVSIFQSAQKLKADAVIGQNTYSALNIPKHKRIDQVKANLERWRLMPRKLGANYIFVDLGRQELDVFINGQFHSNRTVIIGKELRQTPTFIDRVTSVIVNPTWTAPSSIVKKDLLPNIQGSKNKESYFRSLRMNVLKNGAPIAKPWTLDWSKYSFDNPPPFTFQESPGDQNSLGRLKFDLSENHHAIYLHDTNHRELFKQIDRRGSSGCIRVENPVELASALLGKSEQEIESMIGPDSDVLTPKRISLSSPMRVYIIGTTVTVDIDGMVRFAPDTYGQDQRIIDAMNAL